MPDEAHADYCRADYARADVYIDNFGPILKKLEAVGTVSCALTRRYLTLGTRDANTGWRDKEWTEIDVEGALIPKTSQQTATKVGTYVRNDALLLTQDGFKEGDELENLAGEFYEVKATREHMLGDSFSHREVDLTLLPAHADVTFTTYTGTFLVDDARYRTKVYLETYWTDANCEDDSGDPLTVVTMYENPPYPLILEFLRGEDDDVDVILAIGKPESEPIIGHDHAAFGYNEKVSMTIQAINKTNVTGDKAITQCETEIRRICQTYPLGSLRTLKTIRPATTKPGTTLFGAEYVMEYTRGTT